MANLRTAIEWCDATWGVVTGCTKVSAGCKFCYAERITKRFGKQKFTDIRLHPERLDLPLRWRKPRRIFVNSMNDLFHEQVPDEYIGRVFDTMAMADHHTFQILTKREKRMCELLNAWESCPGEQPRRTRFPNVWLGVSSEDQQTADERIPLLLQTPAAVRFVSLEPLLGLIDICPWMGCAVCGAAGRRLVPCQDPAGMPLCPSCAMDAAGPVRTAAHPRLDWVIVGGESGGPAERALVERVCACGDWESSHPGGGPCHMCQCQRFRPSGSGVEPKSAAVQWVRSISDQCAAAGVPFFFKAWGGPTPKSGGRMLDGRTWDEFPKGA